MNKLRVDWENSLLTVGNKTSHIDYGVAKLLQYFLDNPNRTISRQEIIENVWDRAFASDDAINRCISVLRKHLGEDVQAHIKTVPKVGYAFYPNEEFHHIATDTDETPKATSNKYWLAGLYTSAIFAFLYVAWQTFALFKRPDIETPITQGEKAFSAAVMPFVDMSPRKYSQYFNDGVAVQLHNLISATPDIKMASTASSFIFRNSTLDIASISSTLGVSHLVTGRIEKRRNHIALTLSIVDEYENLFWSKLYEIEEGQLVAMYPQLARDIVKALAASSKTILATHITTVGTISPQAHDHFIQGRFLFESLTESNLLSAREHFKQAISLDPSYAMAWSELGITQHFLSTKLFGSQSVTQSLSLGRSAIKKAFELSPQHHAVRAALAQDHYRHGDIEQARIILQSVIDEFPNYTRAYHWLYHATASVDPIEGLRILEKASELDPLSLVFNSNLSHEYLQFGLFEKADVAIQRLLIGQPDSWLTHHTVAENLLQQGNYAEVVNYFRNTHTEMNKYNRNIYAQALASLGLLKEAAALFSDNAKAWGYYYSADFQGLDMYLNTLSHSDNSDMSEVALSAYAKLNIGDYAGAQSIYNSASLCDEKMAQMLSCGHLGYALSMVNEQDAANLYFDRAFQQLESASSKGIKFVEYYPLELQKAILFVLRGSVDEAIELLLTLTQQGYLPHTITAPVYSSLRGHERWPDLLLAIEQGQRQQRQLLSTE